MDFEITLPPPLPCPFCGEPGSHYQDNCDYVGCNEANCWAKPSVGPFASKAEAIAAWNTRTPAAQTSWKAGLERAIEGLKAWVTCDCGDCGDPSTHRLNPRCSLNKSQELVKRLEASNLANLTDPTEGEGETNA